MRGKNPATKSAKKSGGPKIKIREKSVLPKTDPNILGKKGKALKKKELLERHKTQENRKSNTKLAHRHSLVIFHHRRGIKDISAVGIILLCPVQTPNKALLSYAKL